MEIIENNILLSFVIPIYNVEAYLKECIESILLYITDECELILVDDGSTDSSGIICEQYSNSYSRIKIIRKENGGLSSARNAGMSVAKGKYITFVDSDDKVYSSTIKDILQWIKTENSDMCFLSAVKLSPDGTQKDLGEGLVRHELLSCKKEDAVLHLASRPKYPGSAWAKLYRREFLNDNKLHFPYDRRYSEDLGFIRDCILCANNFDFLNVPYYQYRCNRQGSITNEITTKNFNDLLLFIIESAEKLTENRKANYSINRITMSFVAYEYSVLLYLYNFLPKKDKKSSLIKLKDYKWTLKYALNTKCKIISFICSVFGIKITSFIMKQYRKATEK